MQALWTVLRQIVCLIIKVQSSKDFNWFQSNCVSNTFSVIFQGSWCQAISFSSVQPVREPTTQAPVDSMIVPSILRINSTKLSKDLQISFVQNRTFSPFSLSGFAACPSFSLCTKKGSGWSIETLDLRVLWKTRIPPSFLLLASCSLVLAKALSWSNFCANWGNLIFGLVWNMTV